MTTPTMKLPNTHTAFILSIVSLFLGCCCGGTILTLILSGTSLYLAKKDQELYQTNPSLYANYSENRTTSILSIIGIIIGLLSLIASIYGMVTGAFDDSLRLLEERFGSY